MRGEPYQVGDVAALTIYTDRRQTSGAYLPVDPTSVTYRIRRPGGLYSEVTPAVRVQNGVYTCNVPIRDAGTTFVLVETSDGGLLPSGADYVELFAIERLTPPNP